MVLAAVVVTAAQQPHPNNAPIRPASDICARHGGAEVLAFERAIEAAVVRGDVAFVDAATAPTFTFTHGDGWTTGGAPLRVDTRADWMATVAKAPYASRVLDSVKTEVHGDVVITYGRYVGRFKDAAPGPPDIHRVVRTRLRQARWQMAIPLSSHGRWPGVREGLTTRPVTSRVHRRPRS